MKAAPYLATAICILQCCAWMSSIQALLLAFPSVSAFQPVAASHHTISRCIPTFTLYQSHSNCIDDLSESSNMAQQQHGEPTTSTCTIDTPTTTTIGDRQRKEWIDRSVKYYSTVMREERRRNMGQAKDHETPEYQDQFMLSAKKHYFALRKIKEGQHSHAERIYRRIIGELLTDGDEHCDHAKLAVTTLLLALLMQRMGDVKKTRSVFVHFFRVAVLDSDDTECACSAKVLQAYALFEMKQGNALKSLEIVHMAVALDPTLQPVLRWKLFRDVLKRRQRSATLQP